MNPRLVEALRELHLKPGETFTVKVDGRELEIRDLPADQPSVYSGQVMVLPWFESPDPSAGTVTARRTAAERSADPTGRV